MASWFFPRKYDSWYAREEGVHALLYLTVPQNLLETLANIRVGTVEAGLRVEPEPGLA